MTTHAELVKRLRAIPHDDLADRKTRDEAADAIEALEKQAVEAEAQRDKFLDSWHSLRLEADALVDRAEAAEAVVVQCHSHLDGCSHGYPDELWKAADAIVQRIWAAEAARSGKEVHNG